MWDWYWEETHWVKMHKLKKLNSDHQHPHKIPGAVVCTCNPSTVVGGVGRVHGRQVVP